ncbi:hypothetical protein [Sphaerisporangium dianthi]|uniref:Uncharacterized protein n=1 Tax=Sphaerisporangium dianthi TaxID=1436120 RepID=A0ABV9CH09_9ACTN
MTVDDSVRQRLAGQVKIVAVVKELSNTGNPLYESQYVVLRPGSANVAEAIDAQASYIRSLGWDDGSRASGVQTALFSTGDRTNAYLRPLDSFLQQYGGGAEIFPEQRAALKVESTVKDPTGLVLMVLTPFE